MRADVDFRAMMCPVCGLPDAATPCPRCGTDLRALDEGAPRLEILRVAPDRPARKDAR